MSVLTYLVRRSLADAPVRGGDSVAVVLGHDDASGLCDVVTFGGMRSAVPTPRLHHLWTPLTDAPRCHRTIYLGSKYATLTFARFEHWDPAAPHRGQVGRAWWFETIDDALVADALAVMGLRFSGERVTRRLALGARAFECDTDGTFREPAPVFFRGVLP